MDPNRSIADNLLERVLGWSALVQDEPHILLHDHFSQPLLYAAIIAQVANAVHSPQEIAHALNVEPAIVGNYLNTRVRLGLLQRDVPATEREPEQSRNSRYAVTDPYLRFYHRFLAPQLNFIGRGAYPAVWNTIECHWRAFVGPHTYEELYREWRYIVAETGRLPFLPQQIDAGAVNWGEQRFCSASASGSATVR